MARYVLIEFDNNDEADGFVNTFGPMMQNADASIRVLGVYMKPTQFCECTNPGDRSIRGQKYGLMVHKDCGKPKRGVWQSPKNLLVENEKPAKRRMSINLIEPRVQLTLVNAVSVNTTPQGAPVEVRT